MKSALSLLRFSLQIRAASSCCGIQINSPYRGVLTEGQTVKTEDKQLLQSEGQLGMGGGLPPLCLVWVWAEGVWTERCL